MEDAKRLYEQIPYEFKDDEIQHLGEALAREAQHISELREQKSIVSAAIAAQIKEANQRAIDLATKINNRYELRDVEVTLLMDMPRPGMKAIVKMENLNDIVRFEPMTAAEKQQSFGFNPIDEGESRK